MKKAGSGFNPFLPSWEYIPDGEPHVFNQRVYLYGSHDRFNGHAFCLNDYVCWSAPIEDITDWRCEGVIYGRNDDPHNSNGEMCLYAPDVTKGTDGKYYLYYCLDGLSLVSVAVCDEPAGRYRFYGYVRYKDGTLLGDRRGDELQFDPAVFTENGRTYLYTGFCPKEQKDRTGARMTIIGSDMLTIEQSPVTVVPGVATSKGTAYEGHEFFEASSLRKINEVYYFIYSSILSHELCYATANSPTGPFSYGGTIISNGDIGIDTYKSGDQNSYFINNNHGSIEKINEKWYVFYHRHTNGSSFSRQAMLEPVEIESDGKISQVEMTSCGPNDGVLIAKGKFPAYIACSLFMSKEPIMDYRYGISPFPFITQESIDNENYSYIKNITDGVIVGYKYFDCKGVKKIAVKARGKYNDGRIVIATSLNGTAIGEIFLTDSNEWRWNTNKIIIPDGIHALYFKFEGKGFLSLAAVSFN